MDSRDDASPDVPQATGPVPHPLHGLLRMLAREVVRRLRSGVDAGSA
jgi:hypothetical protein